MERFRLAHENDRLRSLLADCHYRNPETGRLSPRGEFPALEIMQ